LARDRDGRSRHVTIDHRFAVATREVTVEEFRRFSQDRKREYKFDQTIAPGENCPATSVSWYAAAEYCNWLSRREGLDECYVPNLADAYGEGMGFHPDYLVRNGYRLPTVDEWQFAAAAGATTRQPWGAPDLAPAYAWFAPASEVNGVTRTHPVGELKPNNFGLFDTFGNVAEWCHDDPDRPVGPPHPAPGVPGGPIRVSKVSGRGVCGGAYRVRPLWPAEVGPLRYTVPRPDPPLGFRLVRTLSSPGGE
jgi:formylglycine-generating enzyme required for sulfatase activity